MQTTADVRPVGPVAVELKLTLERWQGGFVGRLLHDAKTDAMRITAEQAIALRLLATSLREQGAKQANGRFVQTKSEALRWLLDQLAGQVPAELMEALKREAR